MTDGVAVGGRTALYGLVGWPVAHTLSPAMQNAALRHLGLDGVYLPLPVEPARLAEALRGAHALGFQGLNATVPHKQAAVAACERLDPVAAAIGAVNTLRRTDTGWEGFNTDATALAELLELNGVNAGARVLLVGAGGAARAGAWAALQAGASLVVCARREEAAQAFVEALRQALPAWAGAIEPLPWDGLGPACQDADVIMNGSSVGMAGQPAALPGVAFRPGQVAVDMVYGETAFIGAAAAAGATVVRGEAMLLRQGAHGFTIWTGRPAPLDIMAAALRAARARTEP